MSLCHFFQLLLEHLLEFVFLRKLTCNYLMNHVNFYTFCGGSLNQRGGQISDHTECETAKVDVMFENKL